MNKKIIIISIVAAAAMALVILAMSTSGPPPETESELAKEAEHPGLEMRELTVQEQQRIQDWRDSGLLVDSDKFTHEALVDRIIWDGMTDSEKEDFILALSDYFKSFDGTSQVKILHDDDMSIAGDYFGGVVRLP